MPERRQPLFFPRLTKGAGSTTVDLVTPRVPRGEHWVISHVTWEDETTAYTSARLFRRSASDPSYLSEELSGAAGVLYWDDEEYRLAEGEEMGVRLTGTTSGDILRASFSGYRVVAEGA